MTFDVRQLAWAAGLFEGEGCFSFSDSRVRQVSAALNMTDEDIVRRFRAIVGFGAIYEVAPQKSHWKKQWRWRASTFEQVQALMAAFWPWLGVRRRARAIEVLRCYHALEPASIKQRVVRSVGIQTALRRGGKTQRDIAREFGVCPATVTLIKQGMQEMQ